MQITVTHTNTKASRYAAALWARLEGIARDAPEELDAIDEHLRSPRGDVCRFCGQPNLQRWEVLNHATCSRCREKYLAKAEAERTDAVIAGEIGVPEKYRRYLLRTWTGGIGPELSAFLAKPRGMRVVTGKTKSGKTHAATAVLIQLAREDHRCRWIDALEAAEELRRCAYQHSNDFERRLIHTEVLLLDDLGVETDETSIERVLRGRDMRCRATLITTNLAPERIEEANPSLHRRLTEESVIYF